MSFNPDYMRETAAIQTNLSGVEKKIAVMSGKGGVGKSTVAANLATALAIAGKRTGLLDIDLHGPSVPKLLKIENHQLFIQNEQYLPIKARENLYAISIGSLLSSENESVVFRGPRKNSMVRQFLKDVKWGELNTMIVDCPPGTGDEQLSLIQSIENLTGAVIVTTPQDLALLDVRKSITFCKQMNLPIIGIVENMSGLICPDCGKRIEIFKSGGGKKLAEELNIPFLGHLSIDPSIVECSDDGTIAIENASETYKEEMNKVINNIQERSNK